MSRYGGDDYDDQNFENEWAFWEHNEHLALRGRRGRQALSDLREALLALPERRLIANALCTVNPEKRTAPDSTEPNAARYAKYANSAFNEVLGEQGEGVCAVGAYVWHQKVKAGVDPAEAFDSLPTLDHNNHSSYETEEVGKDAGLTRYVAAAMAYRNDESWSDLTAEQRWQACFDWIDTQLALPPLTRTTAAS